MRLTLSAMTGTSSDDAAQARPGDRASVSRWPRPNELDLDLAVELTSRTGGLEAQYGWQVWQGTIQAGWDWSLTDGDWPLPPDA